MQHHSAVVGRPGDPETCAACGARAHSVCGAISNQDLARLAAIAVPTVVEPHHAFIAEGEPAEAFFNVTAGTARLFKLLPDGRQQITGFADTGHFLGLAVSDTYAFSAEGIGPMRICRFSRPRLRRLMDDFPALEQRLLQAACSDLVAAQEQMLLLGRKTARERVASFVVARSRQPMACRRAPLDRFDLPMSRSDIADYLGLTIETVSRTLSRLRSERLIALPRPDQVIIQNRASLERVAEGTA